MSLSAGIVLVRGGPRWRYLLLRAYRYWDFPKGRVEPGEEPPVTARREVREETGLDAVCFDWGDAFFETPAYAGGKVARYYLARSTGGEVTLGVNLELGRPEHHEYRWLEYAAARSLLVPRVQAALDWAASRIGDP